MADFRLRPYQPGDEERILAAFHRVFATRRTPEQWQAIYAAAPDGFSIMLCLDERGQVAAHYGATLHRVHCGEGQTLLAAYGRDAFSLPQYRSVSRGRQGLFQQTAQALFDSLASTSDVSLIYGFAAPRHFKLGGLALGYRPFKGASVWRCPLAAHAAQGVVSCGETRAVAQFGEAFDKLWEARKDALKLSLVRDARFLAWRFGPAQKKNYRTWTFSPFFSKDILGYAVFSLMPGGTAYLVDFCLPGYPQANRAFWARISHELRWLGYTQVVTWLSDNAPDLAQLFSLGFEAGGKLSETVPAFLALDSSFDAQRPADHFYFTMADSDLY